MLDKKVGAALVVGGGIAGMQAALDLARKMKERGERRGGVRQIAADLLKMGYRSFRHYAQKYKL